MRLIIGGSIFFFTIILGLAIYLLADDERYYAFSSIAVLGFVLLITASGSLSAYLWYKRGKVYEERGESGPDD